MTPCVSIIVPVYNTAEFIHIAIDSVLQQTFRNFELLLIDDGSTDKSPAICDEYAAKDGRIKVFHLKNGGVSSARNYGLDQATGDFVAFLDSDDWFDADHLENLLSIQKRNNADVVVIGCTFDCSDGTATGSQWSHEGQKKSYIGYKEILTLIVNYESSFYCVWDKLFARTLIEQKKIRFERKAKLGEDSFFAYLALSNSNVVELDCSRSTYHYFMNQQSATHLANYRDVLENTLTLLWCIDEYVRIGLLRDPFLGYIVMLWEKKLCDIIYSPLLSVAEKKRLLTDYGGKILAYLCAKKSSMLWVALKFSCCNFYAGFPLYYIHRLYFRLTRFLLKNMHLI